jgi:hypothetical protein
MQEIFQFLVEFEIWIYIILGGIVFLYLRKLILAYSDWRASVFGLEKENAQKRFSLSLTFVGLLVFMALAVFILVSFVVPSYPQYGLLLTPTLDILVTPTVTLEAGAMPVLPPPQATIVPVSNEGCKPGEIEWTFPGMGEEVTGLLELKGTVNIPDLGFYKYEFSQPGNDNWITIAAGDETKIDQPLGSIWNTDQLVPGDYILRLVVSDNQNRVRSPCMVSVRIIPQ